MILQLTNKGGWITGDVCSNVNEPHCQKIDESREVPGHKIAEKEVRSGQHLCRSEAICIPEVSNILPSI